jgi:secreted trypsin-like serine protease
VNVKNQPNCIITKFYNFFSVTPRHVLFAAHCVQDKKQREIKEAHNSYFYFNDDYDVEDYVDSEEVNDDPAKAKVSEFIVHLDWGPEDSHYDADIAIAVLRKTIKLTNKIRHVCLNTPSDPIQSFAGRSGSVYGWGLTEHLKTVTELRHVDVQLVDQWRCIPSHPEFSKIMSDTSFCAGARDGRTGACNGNFLNLCDYFYNISEFPKNNLQVTLAAGWS